MEQHPPLHSSSRLGLGLRAARWSGIVLGFLFLFYGPYTYLEAGGGAGVAHGLRSVFLFLYGLILLVPIHRLQSDRLWAVAFGVLALFSVALVFVMIVTVMFGYMAAAERGERLGIPGFEGTLIFFSLMQVPVSLFLRHPDWMD